MLGKTSTTQRQPGINKTYTPQNPLMKQNTIKISDNNELMWNMLDETDTLDATDLCVELDQLIATTLTPAMNMTTTVSTHKTRNETNETTSEDIPCTESSMPSHPNVTPPATRQATAREVLSCFGLQPRPPHTPMQ